MTRTTLATLALLLGAAVLALRLEGRDAMGVVAGALCGSSVSMLGASWQRHTFRTRPQRAFQAVVEVFLFKLAFVLIGTLSFRYVEAAAARIDHRFFLVSFVVTALVIQMVAVFENVRLLKNPPASPGAASHFVQTPSESSPLQLPTRRT
jgi:NhaP-type Na+/H+ or K+/H+ antiporter